MFTHMHTCFTRKLFNNNHFYSDKKLLIIKVINLDTNLQNKKLLIIKIVTIINKKL